MTTKPVPTIEEAITSEMARRGITVQARVAEEMKIDKPKLSQWMTRDTEPAGDSLEAIRLFLRLKSVYDLGPMLVATKLKKAGVRRTLRER